MGTNQIMARSKQYANHQKLSVMVLASVAIDAFRWLYQKPNQIHQDRGHKVKYGLVGNVAGYGTSVIKYYVANGILYATDKRHNTVLDCIKKTHNRYSTIRREKYKCLNDSPFTTKLTNLQIFQIDLVNIVPNWGVLMTGIIAPIHNIKCLCAKFARASTVELLQETRVPQC
jgi:hypothetical protein